jgi:hypothetical protein
MLKRLLNIVLIFSLTLSIIGVSTSKVFCSKMNKEIGKSCCKGEAKDNDCCKKVNVCNRLSSDITVVNASVTIPDLLLFATAYLNAFHTSIKLLEKEHGFLAYNPPNTTLDISVLFQVFRI